MRPVRRRYTENTQKKRLVSRKHQGIPTLFAAIRRVFLQIPWKKVAIRSTIVMVGGLMVVQFIWPNATLRPFTRIDGTDVSLTTKNDAIRRVNAVYTKHELAIYMGSSKKPVASPTLAEADITVDNTKRITALHYPWYLRLVPTSLFWSGQFTGHPPKPTFGGNFDDYIRAHLTPKCHEDPVNATLKVDRSSLVVVKSKLGGQCQEADVMKGVKNTTPVANIPTTVRVAKKDVAPAISDAIAGSTAKTLNQRLGKGVQLKINNETVEITANDLLKWLDFSADGVKLVATVNQDRAAAWLNKNVASKVAVTPGVTKVVTVDFTETSRVPGSTGAALDVAQTVASLQRVVTGEASAATTVVKVVPATEEYSRTYSANDTGLSALMTNYAKDHPGTIGVSMVELDGKKRRASYNGDKSFVTASTYKLFVAYSLMKQIDAGQRDWGATEDCFNKMIKLSDNACAAGFLSSIGVKTVTNDIQSVGLKNSTFMNADNIYSTPNDLALMLGMIATGQNFSSANQQRLIAAMKGNVFRNGIPMGVNGTVADKVGFMNGLLHDAAIVYGPNGTYVLAIMTDGSSWATIADLAKQIDQLRAQ